MLNADEYLARCITLPWI